MAETTPQRLYLIDGYSNIFRAFYAIRELSNSRGDATNAVYGFLQMLRKLLRDEEPELIGVALDVSSQTVRSERYEDYKANRAPMPEDLRPQIPWIRKTIEAYRIPILEMERYEADDVLGTLAKKAAEAGYDVVLVSADKDLAQLVTERVSLMHTGRNKLVRVVTRGDRMTQDPLYLEGHPKRIEQDSQRINTDAPSPSKEKEKEK
jgi:DNA polymerase-1